MARPFPTTFDNDSPLSPQSGGTPNTPISYRTNVNRQKTTKWANAKQVDYGGDDWGDDDGYDLPPPPSKPTGLRQAGQALPPTPREEQPDNKKNYGQLPAIPGAAGPRGRRNSFEEDEERNFSNNTIRQPSPAAPPAAAPTSGPATRFSQITGQPSTRGPNGPPSLSISTQPPPTGLRKTSQAISPVIESPHPPILQAGPQPASAVSSIPSSSFVSPASDTRTPSSDYQARRDFSPSAVPPPLSTRASPAPQPESPIAPAGTRFPARKSSLSQMTGPNLSDITNPVQDPATTPRPWTAGRSASPGAAARSPTTPTGKALPFIRPADIYRRAEEERQSMESGRPSMDSIMGTRSNDPENTANPQIRERSSSDSLGGARRRASFEGDEASDSGRKLMPMLEPVKERKSEYGFEGVNINEQMKENEVASKDAPRQSRALEVNTVDAEEARRQSVSPKLPDLNRISGFGLDMFSTSRLDEPEQPVVKPIQEITTQATEETSLHSQPSVGFRSVVHQAFDRTDDSSVPQTPASRSGSGVRRSDSESTGTTGISPIMSRVPSGAVPDTRNRDFSTPSILEVVDEPDSPVRTEAPLPPSQPAVRGFKPGHRRDISTPSPGNSPARTPDLARSIAEPHEQHVIVSDPSPTSEDESPQQLRPVAEREQSFRPALPGGWTSYATTNDETTSVESDAARGSRSQTPIGGPRPLPERSNDSDLELTPTTLKKTLPQTTSNATLVAPSLQGVVGEPLGQHGSPVLHPQSTMLATEAQDDDLPTPDPSMAPSGNLYSTATLDPRLPPKLEQAPAETQLRPDVVHSSNSALPSISPTPLPPKATPKETIAGGNEEYFPHPPVPLKQKTIDQVEAEERLFPHTRPPVLPTLSTDTRAQDEENDRLRKEIVKSLSPKPSDASHYDHSLLMESPDEAPEGHARESTYLPSEYDNYWASSDEPTPDPPVSHSPVVDDSNPKMVPVVGSSAIHLDSETQPIAPLNTGKASQLSADVAKPALKHKFSWERSTENIAPTGASDLASTSTPPSDTFHSAASGPGGAKRAGQDPETHQSSFEGLIPTARSASPPPASEAPEVYHLGRDAALAGSGVAVAAGTGALLATKPEQTRRLSLAEEKETGVSSYPVSPTPPENEHPARSPHPYFESPNEQASQSPPSIVSQTHSPSKPQATQSGRILAFKEIAALKTQQERIQSFDETRERYAAMDSGLDEWMETLRTQHPEHAEASHLWGATRFSAPSGSARSKFSKSMGGSAPPLQQPYYQQYLNASSPTTPSTPVSRPGPSAPASGPQQGFSPAAGKITTHQVQAKGKEFLHTAGIFGGKAGKAGKGLLAKGKSKLRGAGGGEKVE